MSLLILVWVLTSAFSDADKKLRKSYFVQFPFQKEKCANTISFENILFLFKSFF